ncbi:MAG: ADP-ribosylglycohydrolase family protein [Planctomycetaceae bacterium]|nr:ADP-ribosylglycohydrolase family protein [Planctomycetaceae bacterium]
MTENQIVGCILGTAVGDAIGLPYEGLSRPRAARMLGAPDRHRFCLGRGMVSDDTEHTCMVAQALIIANGDLPRFQKALASSLCWWLLCVPAGVGLATLRAVVRLWLGYSPDRSGVYSAGNGPAMRAAILGVAIKDDSQLRPFVRASSRLTHTDPKAEFGALAVALAARLAAIHQEIEPDEYLERLTELIGGEDPELISLLARAVDSVNSGHSTLAFAESLGLAKGVSGYVYHTVPVAIHAWLSHQDNCRAAIMAVVQCGGDADSTGAIVGGIVGAGVGRRGLPQDWLDGLIEWPRTVAWMEKLGKHVANVQPGRRKKIDITLESPGPAPGQKPITLDDFRKHLQSIIKPSFFWRMFMLLPGTPRQVRAIWKKHTSSEEFADVIRRQTRMIDAMTPEERQHPQHINAERLQQIAMDAGVKLREVRELLTQFAAMRSMIYSMDQPSEREDKPRLPVLGIMARNLFFLLVVLFHGFRRLAPPYTTR